MAFHHLNVGLFWAAATGLVGCSPGDPAPKDRGACDVQGDETVAFATGKGSAYHILENGDELQLVFGSQAGMEARVVVQTEGLPRYLMEYAKIELLVDDYPLAQMTVLGEDCRCEEDTVKMDAPMLVDVVPHPTVKSVLQLSNREAQLVVRIYGDDGVLSRASTEIILLT